MSLKNASPTSILYLSPSVPPRWRDVVSPEDPDSVLRFHAHEARRTLILNARGNVFIFGADADDLLTASLNRMITSVHYIALNAGGDYVSLPPDKTYGAIYCASVDSCFGLSYDTILLGYSVACFCPDFSSLKAFIDIFFRKISFTGKVMFLLPHTTLETGRGGITALERDCDTTYASITSCLDDDTPVFHFEVPLCDVDKLAWSRKWHIEVFPSCYPQIAGASDFISAICLSHGEYICERDSNDEIAAIMHSLCPPKTVGVGQTTAVPLIALNANNNNAPADGTIVTGFESCPSVFIKCTGEAYVPYPSDTVKKDPSETLSVYHQEDDGSYLVDSPVVQPAFEMERCLTFRADAEEASFERVEHDKFKITSWRCSPPGSVNRALLDKDRHVIIWDVEDRPLSQLEKFELGIISAKSQYRDYSFVEVNSFNPLINNPTRLLIAPAPYPLFGVLYYLPTLGVNCLVIKGQDPMIVRPMDIPHVIGDDAYHPTCIPFSVQILVSVKPIRRTDNFRLKCFTILGVDCDYPSGLLGRLSYMRCTVPIATVGWGFLSDFRDKLDDIVFKRGILMADCAIGHPWKKGGWIQRFHRIPLQEVHTRDVSYGLIYNAVRQFDIDFGSLAFLDPVTGYAYQGSDALSYLCGPKAQRLCDDSFAALDAYSKITSSGYGAALLRVYYNTVAYYDGMEHVTGEFPLTEDGEKLSDSYPNPIAPCGNVGHRAILRVLQLRSSIALKRPQEHLAKKLTQFIKVEAMFNKFVVSNDWCSVDQTIMEGLHGLDVSGSDVPELVDIPGPNRMEEVD